MWFKTTAEEVERGASDVRWKTVPQTNGCNRKRSVAVERPEKLTRQNVNSWWPNGAQLQAYSYSYKLTEINVINSDK